MNDIKQTFERCADATLDEVRATYAQRGQEYADSWALDRIVTTLTANVLREIMGVEATPEEMRLLQAAVLCDVKDARLCGPYKRDSIVDGVAYRALFAQLRADLDAHVRHVEP